MAQSAHGDHVQGGMDVADQRATFSGFVHAIAWGCGLLAQAIALLVTAFAVGAGWWAGLAAFVVIGLAVGIIFKLGGGYWAFQIAMIVLMAVGGGVIPLIAGLTG